MTWTALFLANAINPVLVVLLIIAPFDVRRRVNVAQALPFWASAAVGLGIALILAEVGKRLPIWPGHPGFPSGHETFGLACATCLLCYNVRWLWIVVPLLVLLGWALVVSGWHTTTEVFGALLTGPAPALVSQAWQISYRRRVRGQTSRS